MNLVYYFFIITRTTYDDGSYNKARGNIIIKLNDKKKKECHGPDCVIQIFTKGLNYIYKYLLFSLYSFSTGKKKQ